MVKLTDKKIKWAVEQVINKGESTEMAMETKALKVGLLCLGARIQGLDKGRRAGAGPAAGGMFLFGGTVVNVPTQSWFVAQSPYTVESEDGRYVIKR